MTGAKSQEPNPEIQINNKTQDPNGFVRFEDWDLFGACFLDLGI
jgi:hypothetical protein